MCHTTKVDIILESIPTLIYACFVLHNYCEKNNMYIDQDLVDCPIEHIKENEVQCRNEPDPIFSCDVGEGSVARATGTLRVNTETSLTQDSNYNPLMILLYCIRRASIYNPLS